MSRAGWLAVSAGVACACADDSRLVAPPAQVSHLAALRLEQDHVVASTRLTSVELGLALPDEPGWIVLGWSREALLAGRVDVPASLPEDLLAERGVCDTAMPVPTWVVAASGEPLGAESLPRVGFAWLDESCPSEQPVVLDAECAYATCAPVVTRSGCGLELDVTECGAFFGFKEPRLTGRVRQDGAICLWAPSCEPAAGSSITCQSEELESCEIELRSPRPLFEWDGLESVKLLDVTPRRPSDRRPEWLSYAQLRSGYLSDLEVLGQHVVVGTHLGRFEPGICSPELDGFSFVDVESLLEVRTATAPSCVRSFVADGEGGFFALAGHDETVVVRFDERGNETRRVRLEAAGRSLWGNDLVRRSDGALVAVASRIKLTEVASEVFVFEVAPDLSSVSEASSISTRASVGPVMTHGTRIVAVDDSENELLFVDGLELAARVNAGYVGLVYLQRGASVGDKILLPIAGSYPRVVAGDDVGDGFIRYALYFESVENPTLVIPVGEAVWVAMYPHGTELGESTLAALDPGGLAFSTSGAKVATGPISSARVTASGVWMIAPWSGELVRVRGAR